MKPPMIPLLPAAAVPETSPVVSAQPAAEMEYLVVLSVSAKRTVRLRGRLGQVRRGRQDLALSDADLAGLMAEDGHE